MRTRYRWVVPQVVLSMVTRVPSVSVAEGRGAAKIKIRAAGKARRTRAPARMRARRARCRVGAMISRAGKRLGYRVIVL